METSGLPNGSHPGPRRLACAPCQRRKIKCSRDSPCLQCEQAGITCEQSSRKKRARPRIGSKREDDLRNRVASLESLVYRLNGDELLSCASTDVLPSANKYLASPFWSSLAGEVQALREVLEDDEDESHHEPSDFGSGSSPSLATANQTTGNDNFEFIMCNPQNILVLPDALYKPDPVMSLDLCNVHLERVDRTWKVFHAPSLRAFTENGHPYLGREADAPCNQALKAAIHFSAISQLTDYECEQRYGQQRAGLLDCIRRSVEMKLIQADPMNTTALPTLQALVLYVAALRRNDVSRRAWAIFALVVRLAQAFTLHRESADEDFFMRELRRRLWHNIVLLDAFFALDRGSQPLITLGSFSRPLPSNLNDHDFAEYSVSSPARQGQVTDMTFALVVEELSACIHHINFLEDKPAGETWQHRLHLAQAQQRSIEEKYLCYCDPSIDFHRFILKVARVVLTSMTLRAVRPMQRDPSYALPAIDSPWVFELGLNTLRQCCGIGGDPPLAKWKQLAWVQWHPIAVVLAGLCSIKNLDGDTEVEAWQLIDKMMAHSSKFVADTKKGSLWQPIEKLYKKALASKRSNCRNISQDHLDNDLFLADVELNSNVTLDGLATHGTARLDNSVFNQVYAPNDWNVEDIPAISETNDWLDWDAIIADMDTGSNENNILWV